MRRSRAPFRFISGGNAFITPALTQGKKTEIKLFLFLSAELD